MVLLPIKTCFYMLAISLIVSPGECYRNNTNYPSKLSRNETTENNNTTTVYHNGANSFTRRGRSNDSDHINLKNMRRANAYDSFTRSFKNAESTQRTWPSESQVYGRSPRADADGIAGEGKNDSDRYMRPDYMTNDILHQLISIHNKVRSEASPEADRMLQMSWDYDLEASAWMHIEKCKFRKSDKEEMQSERFQSVGENIWIGWGMQHSTLDPYSVLDAWIKEKKYFEPHLRSCVGGGCERYSQLVSSETYKLGCAWHRCKSVHVHGYTVTDAMLLACHYAPGLAEGPLLPYYHGIPCSFCDARDYCIKQLCANGDRDGVTGMPPWPTSPPTIVTTESNILSEEAKIALTVVGSLMGTTFVLTSVIYIGVSIVRRRAEGQFFNYIRSITRRFSAWYDKRRKSKDLGTNMYTEKPYQNARQ